MAPKAHVGIGSSPNLAVDSGHSEVTVTKSAREPEKENAEECSSLHLAAFRAVKSAVLEHLHQKPSARKASFRELLSARKAEVPKLQFHRCRTWNSLPGTITFCSGLAPCCLATTVASGKATGEKSPFPCGAGVGIIRSGNYLLLLEKDAMWT